MNFWKILKQYIQETLPEWRDKFISYKDLKRHVRLISSAESLTGGLLESWKAEADFVNLLNAEINKFNDFFMEQEEEFIIRHKDLQERIQSVIATLGPNDSQPSEVVYRLEMESIKKDIVNFHGEMVLLVNYSNINYIGLAKILKKYDKRTGGLLRLPFIQKVLEEPFFTTDLVSKLVKECESTIYAVFPAVEEGWRREERGQTEATMVAEQSIYKNSVAALVTMQEMRRGSSTYSHFSLPPLNLADHDLIQSFQVHFPIAIP